MVCTSNRTSNRTNIRMNMRALGKLGKKGVSGKVLTIVISLVIAVAALILLWLFLTGAMPLVISTVEDLVHGFKKMLCDSMPIGISWICSKILGV